MSRRSNIFSLPPQAFETIAKDLEIDDLFILSTCSKHSFNLVKNSVHLFKTPEFENPFSINIVMLSDVVVNFEYQENLTIVWHFIAKRNPERFDSRAIGWRSVAMHSGLDHPHPKTIAFRKHPADIYGTTLESIQDVFQFVEHIGSLFNATANHIDMGSEYMVHLKAIQSLPVLKKCSEVQISGGTISHDEMRRGIDGFEKCKQVKFECNFDRNFNLPLEYNCESLSFDTSQITNSHVNSFLHLWIQSSHQKPVDLEITRSQERVENRERFGVYDDKCWMEPGNPKRKEEKWDLKKVAEGLCCYVINYSKSQNRVVFRRETDGMELKVQVKCEWFEESTIYLSGFEGEL